MDNVLAAAFRRHYSQIYRYVRRSGSSHADAEEITQEVFAQAAARLERLTTDSRPLAAWLYTVAQRRLADEGRRRARAARLLTLAQPATDSLSMYGTSVASALGRALQTLPDAQRRVVVLKLLEGRPFAEIALLLGTTEAASRMRFSRALEHLRDELEREGITP
jgi:RNA polymerase sigma-70 factor (ECF subfamily)